MLSRLSAVYINFLGFLISCVMQVMQILKCASCLAHRAECNQKHLYGTEQVHTLSNKADVPPSDVAFSAILSLTLPCCSSDMQLRSRWQTEETTVVMHGRARA